MVVIAVIGLSLFVQNVQAQAVNNQPTCSTPFTQDLQIGNGGLSDRTHATQVFLLQNFLVKHLYLSQISVTGYFGADTQGAVMVFQRANGITPASGFVGSATRAQINAILCNGTNNQNTFVPPVITPQLAPTFGVNSASIAVSGSDQSGTVNSTSTVTATFSISVEAHNANIVFGTQASPIHPMFTFKVLNAQGTDVTSSIAFNESSGFLVPTGGAFVTAGLPANTFELPQGQSGTLSNVTFSFSGKDRSGQPLTVGPYSVEIASINYSINNSPTYTSQSFDAISAWRTAGINVPATTSPSPNAPFLGVSVGEQHSDYMVQSTGYEAPTVTVGNTSTVVITWYSPTASSCNTYGQTQLRLTDGTLWGNLTNLPNSGTKLFSVATQTYPNAPSVTTVGVQCWAGPKANNIYTTRGVDITWTQPALISTTTPSSIPSLILTANNYKTGVTVKSGTAVTLSWSSAGATSCKLTDGFTMNTSVATTATQIVSPKQNTTYTVSCNGSGGTTSKSVTVTVTGGVASASELDQIANILTALQTILNQLKGL